MKGTIANFRSGRHTQNTSHMIISINEVTDREKAAALVGKNVSWKSPAGKEIKGKVASAHGNNGAIRVIFETGMPGQSLGNKIEIA
ncbi:MAG: 50S ribosomal protein L35ae [Candidatus Woesearchaeota archaeon]|jgi:large subunit ribosomal protein L35Ae|nr:50S ribosomal protein L35ae [Candidatus Woesearchaeota archaeon]MDP7263514.1 50S ribosomal protein L35ae [Candidatus Woesearchaeota archaeon]MDP7623191.1 50S ribosomal protein L35ae [Candidatus Woesearchaeota archaeon]HJN56822.1 50S ribosomal protein L35ae [Candidatus Woesearchaeota archaeon]|tara:strand:+ start:17780 stop:18037 length:258 start_codon:yes stop_codon:yes gene_type:complete